MIKEQKSQVIFHNPDQHEIYKIVIDGCVITSGERCDFLINVDGPNTSVLVELKGSDVERAVDQLENTHKQLSQHCKKIKFWIISSTRCPLTSTEIDVIKVKMRRQYGAILIVKNSPVEHTL